MVRFLSGLQMSRKIKIIKPVPVTAENVKTDGRVMRSNEMVRKWKEQDRKYIAGEMIIHPGTIGDVYADHSRDFICSVVWDHGKGNSYQPGDLFYYNEYLFENYIKKGISVPDEVEIKNGLRYDIYRNGRKIKNPRLTSEDECFIVHIHTPRQSMQLQRISFNGGYKWEKSGFGYVSNGTGIFGDSKYDCIRFECPTKIMRRGSCKFYKEKYPDTKILEMPKAFKDIRKILKH